MDPHTAVNQRFWDEVAPLHVDSDFYDVESFLRGASTLGELEIGEVADVAGKRMVHLMCHFGMDTMSWAKRGAEVVGVDFSAEAIRIARDLNSRVSTDAEFVCCGVLDAADHLGGGYDIVFSSKGILVWIRDVAAWARTCARLMRPGGVFYLLDYHPLANVLVRTEEGLRVAGEYFPGTRPATVVKDGSYAVSDAGMRNQESREWSHSLGEVVTALVDAGIEVEFLHEFPASQADNTPVPDLGGADVQHRLPALFSVRGIRAQ